MARQTQDERSQFLGRGGGGQQANMTSSLQALPGLCGPDLCRSHIVFVTIQVQRHLAIVLTVELSSVCSSQSF